MAAAAAAAAIPGFSEDNKRIVDPVIFLESILVKLPGVAELFTGAAGGDEAPTFAEDKRTKGNLANDDEENQKSYQAIPVLGMMRYSASVEGQCCFFDSFLSSMSPKYRTLSLEHRKPVFKAFRQWCKTNSARILAVKPPMLEGVLELTNDEFINDMGNYGREIGYISGWLVGWYIGVNVTYIRKDISGIYDIVCELSYQSPECKTIIIRQGAGHFEPVGVLGLDAGGEYDEASSKFLFDWSDPRLCSLKVLAGQCQSVTMDNTWLLPEACAETTTVEAARKQVAATLATEAGAHEEARAIEAKKAAAAAAAAATNATTRALPANKPSALRALKKGGSRKYKKTQKNKKRTKHRSVKTTRRHR